MFPKERYASTDLPIADLSIDLVPADPGTDPDDRMESGCGHDCSILTDA
jgi:hypothetical protein